MYYQEDRQFPEPSTKGDGMGSGTAQFARHLPLYRCLDNFVLWLRKISPVAHKGTVKFQICLARIYIWLVTEPASNERARILSITLSVV